MKSAYLFIRINCISAAIYMRSIECWIINSISLSIIVILSIVITIIISVITKRWRSIIITSDKLFRWWKGRGGRICSINLLLTIFSFLYQDYRAIGWFLLFILIIANDAITY